jgi:hypothetical protein
MKLLCGAIALCALVSVSCSRRGTKGGTASGGAGSSAASVSQSDTFAEGTSLGPLRIDETTVPSAAKSLGLTEADARPAGQHGELEMKVRWIRASFVPPSAGQGGLRLYAVLVYLGDDIHQGKTTKGIGFLDSADAMRAAYGPPDAEWITGREHIHYYQQGVIFQTQHPSQIPAPLYAKAKAALRKEPSEGPNDRVVTAIMVVRPFTVKGAAQRAMGTQLDVTGPPETDLLISPF